MENKKKFFWCLHEDCLFVIEPFYSKEELDKHYQEEHMEDNSIESTKENELTETNVSDVKFKSALSQETENLFLSIEEISRQVVNNIIEKISDLQNDSIIQEINEVLISEKIEYLP